MGRLKDFGTNIFSSQKKQQKISNEEKTAFEERERIEAILDQPIFTFPNSKSQFTYADAVTGIHCFGEIGSGKSSGAMKFVAKNYLKEGFGFLVPCAKADEGKSWVSICKETDRKKDLVIFCPNSKLGFNFLSYEMHRKGAWSGETINLVNLLRRVYEVGQNFKAGGGSGKEERFWTDGTDRLLGNTIDLLRLSRKPLTFANIRKIIINMFIEEEVKTCENIINSLKQELPTEESLEQEFAAENLDEPSSEDLQKIITQAKKEEEDLLEYLTEWQNKNFFLKCFMQIDDESLDEKESRLFDEIEEYFFKQNVKINPQTRAIFVECILGLIEPFLREGILKEHFTNEVSPSLLPERIYSENAIIVVDFSIKEHGFAGAIANVIMKLIFQICLERRIPTAEENPRPAVLWIDEAHLFIDPTNDTKFQSTSRSVMAATVYITQNLNAYYSVMGENNAVALTKNLISNISTKIFCANSCFDTNEYAAQIIGKSFIRMDSMSYGDSRDKDSISVRYEYHYKLLPEVFTSLKRGRRTNKYQVEAITFQTGRIWRNKQNYAKLTFDQRY